MPDNQSTHKTNQDYNYKKPNPDSPDFTERAPETENMNMEEETPELITETEEFEDDDTRAQGPTDEIDPEGSES